MKKGYFSFVLHSHLPYVRKAGRWPHGEEMVHEAIAETYIPLLNALTELKNEGLKPKVTLGLTPILVEQLADWDVMNHFELYAQEKAETALADISRFEEEKNGHLAYLAKFYVDYYRGILDAFRHRYGRSITGAFRQLQEEGNVEILTSAATHAYLPLMERDSTIFGQLKTGVDNYRHHFGRSPRGVWLPECGYRPAYYKEDGEPTYKPGIEDFLAELNLLYFFTDTHVIEGGEMVGKVTGDVVGPYGGLPKRKLVVKFDERAQPTEKTTFRPYYVESTKVAVFGRDERTGLQVWSAAHGYPGDFVYREFHRKDFESGFQYWRITDASGDLGSKQYYDPHWAFKQTHMHADHFAGLVHERVNEYYSQHGTPGVVISAYDSELFGHWWFEGVAWLKEVIKRLARSESVEVCTAGEYLDAYPPQEVMTLPESSWGMGGAHFTWYNENTIWIWPFIHNAEVRMEKLVEKYPDAYGDVLEVLNQMARELVLLESSDWPFLISTGQAKEYATGRFQQHLARFNHLNAIAEAGCVRDEDRQFLESAKDLDNPFPRIDYRVFRKRESFLEGPVKWPRSA
ncbi:MAG: DUF1957 domain-containing protein [Chloroflexi bacterium]|nr:DUF1957 domain-containing protein [Chloroflexota bacterium]